MPTIHAPAELVGEVPTDGVAVEGETVGDALRDHAERHGPALLSAVTDGRSLAAHVDVYVDGTGVRRRRGLATPVAADGEIRIVPRPYQG